jgi:5-methylthioadenosine/S-adenosylhomocysteine deaminase
MSRGISADYMITVGGKTFAPGWLVTAGAEVVAVGGGEPPSGVSVRRAPRGSAVVPGFVDAHAHLALGDLSGVADDRPFLDWLNRGLLPRYAEAERDPSLFRRGAERSVDRLLRTGVTCVADNFLRTDGAHVLRGRGMKGVHFHEVFGSMAADEDAAWRAIEPVLDGLAAELGGFPFGYSPHTPWTCPRATFERVVGRARREARRLSFHLSESAEEQALFADRKGPLFDAFERQGRLARYDLGKTPAEAMAALGALGPRTLVAHGVYLTDADVTLLAETGTSLAHCPTSNAKLAEGVAPIATCLQAGVNVALGTDSAASSARLDLFDEMRAALWFGRANARDTGPFTAETALRMATVNGARALGLEGKCGVLAPGAAADYVVLDVSEARHGPVRDVVSTIVWSCDARDVAEVVIDGETRFSRDGAP